MTREEERLADSQARRVHWRRWGPFLAERQWGTVREDYSPDGDVWRYFTHDQSRSRAYRWGEDGIAGICDRHQRICFALALWNERDPILKERLFGLTNERRQSRRRRKGILLLSGRHAHQLLSQISLQVSPSRHFPMSNCGRKICAAPAAIRNSNWWIPAFSMTTAISMCSSNTPKPPPKTF